MRKDRILASFLAVILLLGLSAFSAVLDVIQRDIPVPEPEIPVSRPVIPETTLPAPTEPAAPELAVHFIDVGQADSILLECEGEFMLIDGGNVEDSQLVVSYLEQQGVDRLAVMICTHGHEDHVGGLAAVLAVYPTDRLYCSTRTYSSHCFDDFLYYADQQRLEIHIPAPGDMFFLGSAEVTILGPVRGYADHNDASIVCRVVYGETSFLFTGDAEREAEQDILNTGLELRSDVLKMGHHGSGTSTSYRFLREVDPAYTVISVGTGNDYGHPHEQALSRLHHAGTTIFRTDRLGTVVARSDGRDITFFWENQSRDPELAEYDGIYIGNTHSRRVHSEICGGLPSHRNRVEFATLQEALDAGYSLCSACLG